MAITEILSNKLADVNIVSNPIDFKSATIAEGFKIPFMGKDFKSPILIIGGATDGIVTFKMGNGIQAVTDMEIAVPKTKTVAITLDSGSFKYTTGINKGYVLAIPSAVDIKLAIIELA